MNHSNNYLKRKRNSSENYNSIDMKKEDGELGGNDHNKSRLSRDYGKPTYRNKPNRDYSPQNKRRPSYDSPHRSYSRGYKDDFYFERERRSEYYERRDSSELRSRSEESSFREVRRESSKPALTRPSMKKKYNFLVCLPKNYFRFIDQNYDKLYRQVLYFYFRLNTRLGRSLPFNMIFLFLVSMIIFSE
jgi:hypothetical protein